MPARRKHAALIGLTLALLIRAFVPTGWMFAAAAGGPSLILCPAAGPVSARPAMHDAHSRSDSHDEHRHRPENVCPFAVLLAPPLPGNAPILPPPAVVDQVPATNLPPTSAVPSASTSPPPPATGPPAAA